MVFGEIIEPSTRAYLSNDEDYQENDQVLLEWDSNIEPPKEINTILIVESEFIIKLTKECLLTKNIKAVCASKKNEISIYSLEKNCYVVVCNSTLGMSSCAEITEKILPWVENSNNVYSLISAPSAVYQNKNMSDRPISFLRTLETLVRMNICPQLETPNLVTGVGANILTYCTHTGKKCALFIGYLDHAPMDSINSKPFTDLFKKIDLIPVKSCLLQDKMPSNNLYM